MSNPTGSPLAGLRALLIDLDGVVYTGQEPIAGASWFLAEARRRHFPCFLVTNNSTTSPRLVAERLRGMDIFVEPRDVASSAEAAAAHARAHGGGRAYVVGEAGLREALEEQGLTVLPAESDEPADWVVAGLFRQFDYATLTRAVRAILNGARFLATNTDALLPVEGGAFLPGAGSIVGAIQAATGVTPIVTGKPEPAMFAYALERAGGLAAADVAMVGDRLDTDIEGGQRAGLRTILVYTGIATPEQAAASPIQADASLDRLSSVAELLGWDTRFEQR